MFAETNMSNVSQQSQFGIDRLKLQNVNESGGVDPARHLDVECKPLLRLTPGRIEVGRRQEEKEYVCFQHGLLDIVIYGGGSVSVGVSPVIHDVSAKGFAHRGHPGRILFSVREED